MTRLEIIANRSVEEDIMEALKKASAETMYTKIPVVHGEGHSSPKQGDPVWPEENFLLIIYCKKPEADKIKAVIKSLKTRFSGEGIKLFEL